MEWVYPNTEVVAKQLNNDLKLTIRLHEVERSWGLNSLQFYYYKFFFYPFHLVLTLLFCTVLLKKYQFSCFNSKQAFSLYKTSRKLKMICFGNFFPGTKSSWYQMNEVILILMKFLSMAEIRTTTMHHVKRSLQGVGVGISFSVTVWLDSW